MSISQGAIHAFRSLRRAPLFAASVVLTLTVGIGSSAAIFAIVNAVLVRPLPYGNPDRLVNAWHNMSAISFDHANQTLGTYLTYKQFAHSIEDIALYQTGSENVTDPNGQAAPERITAAWATANAIPLLQISPILGRSFNDAEDQPKAEPVVVISEGLWKARYASDQSVVGKMLVISGKPTRIVGVMPERFHFPAAETKLWFPLRVDKHASFSGGFNYDAVARLKPGVTVAAAQHDFANVLPRVLEVAPNLAPGITMRTILEQAKPVPLLIPMRDDMVGDVARMLWMVAATAILVLLATCANVANLQLVRADGRHRELSVRAALGAGQRRVLTHFFSEAGVLTAISALLGLGVAWIAIRVLVSAGPAEIPRLSEVSVDGAVAAFTLIVAILVAIACSAIPAIRFLRGDPLAGLRDGGRGGTAGGKRQRARSALVAAQVAFALVVLATSGLLFRSFQRLRAVRPGFNPDGVATLWLTTPEQRYPNDSAVVRFYAQLVDGASRLPGVKSVGLTSRLPLHTIGANNDPFFLEGETANSKQIPPLELYTIVGADYFQTMGVPLVAGRFFDPLTQQRQDEAIISVETAKQFFHDSTGRSALNKRFQELPGGAWHTIIGVVGGVRDTSFSAPPTRVVYLPKAFSTDTMSGQRRRTMAIAVRTTGDVAATTRALQRLVHDTDPTLPTFDVHSMRETVDASMARLSFTMIVLAVAAGVTLLLSVVGLYGVIAYVVTLRTRELGVRIALGAQPSSVSAMVTRQGLTVAGIGVVVGLLLVLASARFIRSLLFEIAPTDPVTLGGATALLVLFALIASWIPARRAARVNPIEALRSD